MTGVVSGAFARGVDGFDESVNQEVGPSQLILPAIAVLTALAYVHKTTLAERSVQLHNTLDHLSVVVKNRLSQPSTWKNEGWLPKLPLPILKQTIDRFLKSVEPLLSEKEYEETKTLALEFVKQIGPQLQFKLCGLYAMTDNWIKDIWEQVAYLRSREPTFFTDWYGVDGVKPRTFIRGVDRQCTRAASIIDGLMHFRKQLIDGQLENITSPTNKNTGQKVRLETQQFSRLFGVTRVPGIEVDRLEEHPESTHIAVICKGQAFRLDVCDDEGNPICKKQLNASLKRIKAEAQRNGSQSWIGALSGQRRDEWAKDREKLLKNETNRESLRELETALFVVCLDDVAQAEDDQQLAESAVMGRENGYFDKLMQIHVMQNGKMCAHLEHTPADATIAATAFDYMLRREEENQGGPTILIPTPPSPLWTETQYEAKPLRWELSGFIRKIKAVDRQLKDLHGNIDLKVFEFNAFGRNIKHKGVSPDAFVQMALQLAHRWTEGKDVLVYETASTRMFKGGRTETIRSFSTASKALIDYLEEKDIDNLSTDEKAEARQFLLKALISQVNYRTAAMTGKGVDRHLTALRVLAAKFGVDHPFFQSPGMKLNFDLATSQTPCEHNNGGGFFPVTQDGYGVSYDISRDGSMTFHITSFKNGKSQGSEQFSKNLEKALQMLHNVLKD